MGFKCGLVTYKIQLFQLFAYYILYAPQKELRMDSSPGTGPYIMTISVFDFENLHSTLEKAVGQEANINSSGRLI